MFDFNESVYAIGFQGFAPASNLNLSSGKVSVTGFIYGVDLFDCFQDNVIVSVQSGRKTFHFYMNKKGLFFPCQVTRDSFVKDVNDDNFLMVLSKLLSLDGKKCYQALAKDIDVSGWQFESKFGGGWEASFNGTPSTLFSFCRGNKLIQPVTLELLEQRVKENSSLSEQCWQSNDLSFKESHDRMFYYDNQARICESVISELFRSQSLSDSPPGMTSDEVDEYINERKITKDREISR